MKRILTKLFAALVPCLLVVGSIGFACLADETESETVDTTVETEQEQSDEQTDDKQNDEQEGDLPDDDLPPSEQASDETSAPDDKTVEDTALPEETSAPEEDAAVEVSDEEATVADEPKEDNPDVDAYVPGEVYVWKDIDPSYKPAKSLVSAGSGIYRYQFTGNNAKVYQLLKNYFSQVANGSRTSTVFEITFEALGVAGKYYSASDLGLDAVVVNGSITAEAQTKMDELVDFDIGSIRDRLLVECPFECYWYDKTAQVTGKGYGIRGTYIDGEYKLYFSTTGFTYSFPVAGAYAGSTYEVSASQVNRALAASNYAKHIVAKYKNLSDYEKLVKYKEEICALVDYNHPAADNDDTPFGDPWQLIYVFDGDTSTKVVCEGYSKAFKYLCDLTDFDEDITCILVSGNFQSSSGTNGGHMWNIVSFGNGMTYMVDVTNCDDGAIGQTDKLFLKKYTANSSTSTYSYKISSVTCYYTYYNSMFTMYRDSALDLADDSLAISPAINISSSCKGFDMTWDPVQGAQYYDVFRRTATTGWQYMGAVVDSVWYDYNLVDGTTYYFAVRAVDSNNNYLTVYNDQNYLEFVCVHTPVTDPAVDPTYYAPGLTEGSHCSVCGEVFVEQQEIPALKMPIIIVSQPEDFEGAVGKTATFKVNAAGEALSYQWQLKKGSNWVNLSSGGATTDTMTIKIDESKNGKVYRCLITSTNGLTDTTNEVTLHVKEPTNAITITTQPVNFAGTEGSTAKFTIAASGEGLTYQWQLKKGKSWSNLTSGGATSATLSVKVDSSKNGKVYRCLITDANGEELASNEVSITVKQPSNAIKINTQPSDFAGAAGTMVKFTVVAEGEGLTYQWQLKKGSSWANLTSGGATTSSLSIKIDASKNGKVYRCVITDANGEMIATQEVTITVKEPSNAIVIVSQPESYDGPAGNTARFTVAAEGEGLTYQWQLKKGNSWADLTSGGAKTSTLSIKADYSRDGKIYRCIITDANGDQIISDEATITIREEELPVPA
ncbi:hypothetical protein B0O40_0628 [Ruminococcaceae bacterium R-25]|nr:hypothetical protein B0O40_0628 [Ruminococcaceae bacterium R-25]SUQ11258.1 hypothetical protein SAMN06297423_0628 [Oscillospiraceae bacterium]